MNLFITVFDTDDWMTATLTALPSALIMTVLDAPCGDKLYFLRLNGPRVQLTPSLRFLVRSGRAPAMNQGTPRLGMRKRLLMGFRESMGTISRTRGIINTLSAEAIL